MRSRSGWPSGSSVSSARSPSHVVCAQRAMRAASVASPRLQRQLRRQPQPALAAQVVGCGPSAARRVPRGPARAPSSGRSRWNSWSCSVRVPVETMHPPARQQRRHQVGEGLAGAGARLGHQPAALRQRLRPRLRPSAAATARGRNPGSARASGPAAPKISSRSCIVGDHGPDCGRRRQLRNTWRLTEFALQHNGRTAARN